MLTNKLMGAAGGADKVYVEDVFSTYLYTGNGGTQTINNGIALADGVNIPIGTALAGGYFGGFISTSGTGVATHALIVAPKSSGENSSKQWKTTNDTTSGTSSVIDGPTNSANMNNASHPAAQFCEGLTIGGYSDWYMPARNELEVLYYFLKPTTDANFTSFGSNANAVSPQPINTNYTAGSPAQTSATAFRSGGAEAFAAGGYWSSTEGSASFAWGQYFSNGGQYLDFDFKFNSYYVRAVRRVAIADAILDPYRVTGKGGLVWLKSRSASQHGLYDTTRGATQTLSSDQTAAQATYATSLTAFNANGFSIGSFAYYNSNATTYASWTFRKQAKFFDVVTYTGNGAASRQIAHNLGSVPGCIILKRTNTATDWWVYHRSTGLNKLTRLNTTGAADIASIFPAVSSTSFQVDNGPDNNTGDTYIAYLFAHDAGGFGASGTDNVISCGSYTGNGSTTGPTVTLGYEPQYLMIKNASGTGNWQIIDNMRGMPVGSADATLQANLSNAESSVDYVSPTATGFQVTSTSTEVNASSNTYIYIAIRRGPMRTPTSGTSVFSSSLAVTTAPAWISGFPVDLGIYQKRSGGVTYAGFVQSRLQGQEYLPTNSTAAAVSDTNAKFDYMNGYYAATGVGSNYISWMWKRAPGFFDVVCYTGTGVARTVNHNLGVVPEMMIVKARSAPTFSAADWAVYAASLGATGYVILNGTNSSGAGTYWNSTQPTDSVFSISSVGSVNEASKTYVAYLFASAPGVSKVGSYTGNGTSQTINCGFTAGARFVLIKRTDSTGDWYTWDSARGIIAGNDPHLSLNTTASEVTTNDSIDPDSTGFIVNQVAATNINVSAATYIYLAIA